MPHDQLSALYPRERLATVLPPPGRWRPLPPAADRAAWGAVPGPARARTLALARAHLADELPELPADGFTAYGRTGDRERYERAYFARRTRLGAAVAHTVLAGPGTATAELDAVARLICAEPTWCLPAHEMSHDAQGDPAPDPARPTVDLFAADTAALLAHTLLLVGDELPEETAALARAEVRSRVLVPYRTRDDWWWLGLGGEKLNNWTSWIISNVLPAALLLEETAEELLDSVARAVGTLGRYLDSLPEDGGCDEGIHYWWRSAASYFECVEALADATGDPAALRLPKTAALARYPVTAHVAGDWFVNFADGRPRMGRVEPGLLFRYGRRVGEPEVAALATATPPADSLDAPDVSLARLLTPLLDAEWQAAAAEGAGRPPLVRQRWLPDTELLVARERGGDPEGLFLAAKGGHNGEFHNHNDVGSFVLANGGVPVVIDLGVGTYTRKTFGPDRYDIWTMGSAWHNLPLVNGVQQAPGEEHAAREVTAVLTDDAARLELDLAATWPAKAQVTAWRRALTLRRADADGPAEVAVEETWRLAAPPGSLALHLVTTHPVAAGPTPGSLLLGAPGHRVLLEYDPSLFCMAAEERAVDDPKLAAVWGATVHRVRLVATAPIAEGTTRLTFRAAEAGRRGA
ncbi:heparinase II/III domain-containing protein [Streptomyces triticirhizae]|uniref:Heparinase n=1 Tax=Streptomyces triticirhizae TaxID=2483353 RepID=A0A3M2LD84_9ACTN|nr:heparinase II/III family protein [Streptomyces triticirhizae]RMI34720.1 heparinase [Streptomyces triticirhizae]